MSDLAGPMWDEWRAEMARYDEALRAMNDSLHRLSGMSLRPEFQTALVDALDWRIVEPQADDPVEDKLVADAPKGLFPEDVCACVPPFETLGDSVGLHRWALRAIGREHLLDEALAKWRTETGDES